MKKSNNNSTIVKSSNTSLKISFKVDSKMFDINKVLIREANIQDLDQLSDLMYRFLSLNNEFDQRLKVCEDFQESIKAYLRHTIESKSAILLVAELEGRIIGFLKAGIYDRIFHEPRFEGRIQEFYVLPSFRRKGIGERLLKSAINKLKGSAGLITAEFPYLNTIAVNFYKKMGFRAISLRCFKDVLSDSTTP